MSTRTRTLGRGLIVGGAAILAFVLLPELPATAHAVFVSAVPGPGTSWSTSPASVRMEFSEPLNAGLSGIDIYGSSGRAVPLRSTGADPADPRAYAVALPRLRPDRYTVVWHTISAVDGHSRRGSYTFTVDLPDGSAPRIEPGVAIGPGGPGPPPTSAQAVVRWVGLAGLFLLAGSVLVAALGSGAGVLVLAGTWQRLRLLSLVGCGGLLAGTIGDLISAWLSVRRSVAGLDEILSSSAGRWWETRLAVIAVVVYAFPRSAKDRLTAARGCVLATGIGATTLTYAATSHGAAAFDAAAGIAYEFVHVLAASVWLGGATAVAALWAIAGQGAGRRKLLHRYSITAGIALPAVLLSGLGNAVLEIGSIGDLVSSSYGAALLVKFAVLFVLITVAAVNALALKPAFDSGQPRGRRLDRTIAIEAVLGLLVLAPTAALAVLAPPRPSDSVHALAARMQAVADPADTFSGTTRVNGRAATIDVTPGAVGTNAVRVELTGVHTARRVLLAVSGQDGQNSTSLVRTGLDHDPATHTIYQGSLQLTHAGVRQAILRPSNSGTPSVPIIMPVSKGPAAGYAAVQSSGLTTWLGIIALIGLAAMLIATARAVPVRRVRSMAVGTGAAGLSVAVVWAGIVAVGAPSPDAPRAGWGEARSATPVALANGRVWQVPTPAAGLMMPAIAPDGSVWVAEMDSNKLARLDPGGNLVQEFTFPGTNREPMGVAVAPDGRVWLAQEHAMALGMFDPTRGRYREFHIPGGVSAPLGIALGAAGEVWFTESSGNRIGRFDPGTARFTQYPLPTPDAMPYWLALDATGRVWFTEFASGKVGSLDPRTGDVREYTVPGTPNVAGITVANDGTVWFVTCQGRLFALTPSSGRLRRIILPIAGDYGVAVSPDGLVWVGRDGGRTIFAVDPVSGRSRNERLPAGSAPWWPVVDHSGHVWVALTGERGNGLAELDPA